MAPNTEWLQRVATPPQQPQPEKVPEDSSYSTPVAPIGATDATMSVLPPPLPPPLRPVAVATTTAANRTEHNPNLPIPKEANPTARRPMSVKTICLLMNDDDHCTRARATTAYLWKNHKWFYWNCGCVLGSVVLIMAWLAGVGYELPWGVWCGWTVGLTAVWLGQQAGHAWKHRFAGWYQSSRPSPDAGVRCLASAALVVTAVRWMVWGIGPLLFLVVATLSHGYLVYTKWPCEPTPDELPDGVIRLDDEDDDLELPTPSSRPSSTEDEEPVTRYRISNFRF